MSLLSFHPSASFAPLSSSSRLTLTRLASYQEDFYIAAIPPQDASAYDRLLEKLRDKDFNPLNPFDVGFKGLPSFSLPSIDVRILEAPIPKVTLPGSLGGTFVPEINSRVAQLVEQIYSSHAYTELTSLLQTEVLNPYINTIKAIATNFEVDEGIALFLSIVGTFGMFSLLTRTLTGDRWRFEERPTTPYESGSYNPTEAKLYFESKSLEVALRQGEILQRSISFAITLLIDYFNGKLTDPDTEIMRGKQVTKILADLGPTFIKVGQSLSIRSDLLRPAYLQALTKLQDEVPPFDSKLAVEIVEREIGKPIDAVFKSGISSNEEVVAAASLGQVYRAKLVADGTEVAVKVQRPDILDLVALDMHILREAAPFIKKIAGLESDLVGIVDDWGNGFVDELNYLVDLPSLSRRWYLCDIILSYQKIKTMTARNTLKKIPEGCY